MAYLILKTLHIVSVVMFLGNITTGIFWKEHADRSRDARIIAHMLEGIIRSDRFFTLPGVAGILIGGLGAATVGQIRMLHTGWILWALILFALSGLAFGVWVAPLQSRMLRLMREGVTSGSPDWGGYHRLSRLWAFWGAVALLAPAAAVILMVVKPALPAP